LLSQKSEHKRIHDCVCQDGDLGRLTGHHLTWGDCEKHTGAERHEQRSCHEQIVLCENKTHSLRDHGVRQEEDETVEEYRHTVGTNLTDGELHTICPQQHTGAEGKKQHRRDRDFLGSQ